MNTRPWLLAALLLAALSACSKEKTCASGENLCDGSCFAAVDPDHCGACGNRCGAGQACALSTAPGSAPQCLDCAAACGAGQTCADRRCTSDLYVACFATDQVMGVTSNLGAYAAQYRVDDGPISLARGTAGLYVAHARLTPVIDLIVPGQSTPKRFVLPSAGGQSYVGFIRERQGRVVGANSGVHTLMVIDGTSGAVVDEISLAANPGDYANPHGFDFVGSRAYVALYGDSLAAPSYSASQQIAVVDLSTVPGSVVTRISLDRPDAHDGADAFPYPSGVAAVGSRVFVTLANLKYGEGLPGYQPAYVVPAGDGKLAVVDADQGALSSIVDLGPACQNPGSVVASGTTLWVACVGATPGSAQWSAVPPSIVQVDVSGPPHVVGTVVTPSAVAGSIAFCNGAGYVADQNSGKVARFDPTGAAAAVAADVCPVDSVAGFAYAADVACGP